MAHNPLDATTDVPEGMISQIYSEKSLAPSRSELSNLEQKVDALGQAIDSLGGKVDTLNQKVTDGFEALGTTVGPL